VANFSNYAIKWFRFIIFQKQSQEFPIALKLLPLVQQTLRLSTPSDGKRFNRPQALTISATSKIKKPDAPKGTRFNRPQALTISATNTSAQHSFRW